MNHFYSVFFFLPWSDYLNYSANFLEKKKNGEIIFFISRRE